MQKYILIVIITIITAFSSVHAQIIHVMLDLKNHKNDNRNITGCNLDPQTNNYKMYIHSGVCTATTPGVPDTIDCQNPDYVWEHVVGDWGLDNGKGLMSALPDSVWEIFIDVDTFYSNAQTISQGGQSGEPPSTVKPVGSTAYSMGFVFRNEDGTIGGKTGGCTDFFIFNLNQGNTGVDVGQPGFTLPDSTFSVENTGNSTSIDEVLQVSFESVYPNPFSDQVKFTYTAPKATNEINFSIFNTLGQRVRNLYQGPIDQGVSTITWDANNDLGAEVVNGLYYMVISNGKYSKSEVLIKQK